MRKPLKIAYFGNRIQRHGFSPTTIDKLSVILAKDYDIVTASHVRNQVLRLLDMVQVLMCNRDASYVLIDTYSTRAFYYAFVLAILCQWLSIPYVPIVHGGNLAARLERSPGMCRHLFGRSFRNIAPSRFLQSVFAERNFAVQVIPNPLDIENYPFRRRHEVHPRLLYVRSFGAIYNPGLGVRILAGLVAKHPTATLCMVGPDKDGTRAEVEALVGELGLDDRVRFTGQLAPATWCELSRDYDIFINTTNVDNTPVSVLEAMALGLPVVSTSVGGLPYLITDGKDGYLVDRDSPEQFVERINRLIASPALVAEMTWNGRNTARQFCSEKVRHAWKELLTGEPAL